MPATEPLSVTPSGAEVVAFRSEGDAALQWRERLRRTYPASGLWPLLMETDAPEYLADPYTHATAAEPLAAAYTLDGAVILAEDGERDLHRCPPDYAAEIRSELAGGTGPGLGIPPLQRRRVRPLPSRFPHRPGSRPPRRTGLADVVGLILRPR
ncbi:hypothetical protein SAMN06264365_13632 [Actinoplanes regularis]|uniref:Uncharacterized protein n=2 Tax=Actinoplanes regularis TaxID=52697 RepID=A0A239JPA4_9ACTN|nr:hypothetical protein SAMN06264365_13632 [Actinoplanes regularis]